jgi:endonuclease G
MNDETINSKSFSKKNEKNDLNESRALKNFIRTRGAEYLKDPNISSIGIGYKIKDGKRTDEIAIQFTVDQKIRPEVLAPLKTTLIPESFTIDGKKISTDVIQRKFAAEYKIVTEMQISERKKRMDPIMPGISVANVKVTAGTIECIVYDNESRIPYILSNWHVFQGPEGSIGDEIVQPGPFDDNRIEINKLGKLVRSHLGHAGDCAIATIEGREFVSNVMDLEVKVDEIGEAELGDKVIKSGRTTGVTHGVVTRIDTIAKIDYGGSIGEQEIGCFEIGIDQDKIPENGEVSMDGDSGSMWIFKNDDGKPSNILAGLHFAGESFTSPTEYAIACYPKSVFEKLQISLTKSLTKERESMMAGFSQNFLSFQVNLPDLTDSNKQQMFVSNQSGIINYTHFSLALNKIRRFPFWVGWNVDGGNIKKISRKGTRFIYDPNIPIEFQVGDELYAGNKLDRGHIARRADLLWGNLQEANKANKDSFFFTNITPQMENFNQSQKGGLWGKLEDAVFEDTDVDDLKVSIFGGPVFRDDDRQFRQIKIPRAFWKVIVFVENQKLKAKGFLLTQDLDELKVFDLDPFKIYQVALGEIESRCGIIFPDELKAADSVGKQIISQKILLDKRKPIETFADIDWS